MVEVRMRWISREETTAELQGSEFFRKRRAFFNDNNEDFRLKQPGVRWQLVKEKRVEVYQDCISRIKEVFDEVCEKITGERRKSTSSPLPVLPTIKTPAISKFRSRAVIHRKCPANAENISPERTGVHHADVGHRRSTRQSTRLLSQIQPQQETFNKKSITDPVSPKVMAHSIPLRCTRQSTRLQSKVYSPKKSLPKTEPCTMVPDSVSSQSTGQSTQPPLSQVRMHPVPDPTSELLHSEDISPEVVSQVSHTTMVKPDTESQIETSCVPKHPSVRHSTRLSRVQSEHKTGIQKLQEEHRSRNKGRMVSLSELRNASPAFKESSKKIRTRCKPPAGTSITPRIGNKRLRSVSLERLSTDHLQATTSNKSVKLSLDEKDDINAPGGYSESQQDESSPMKLSGTDEESSDVKSTPESGEESRKEVSPLKSGDVLCYEESPDEKSSPENDVIIVSGESSQDEVSPSKFRVENEESPDNCGSSSPDEEVISDTKYDEEYSQDAVSPVHDHREDKTKTVSKYSKLRVFNFFSKKGGTADAMVTNKASAAAPLSFLARNSPQKLETFQSRQEKLTTKVLLRKEEEERRKDEWKMRKQQELQEKVKKREERRKRVAENQAELRKQQAEKKRKLEDLSSRDEQIKKINQMKAKENEEKNKKLKQRMHAAEVRRKQEEEQQKKRLQQLEDERRMVTELANKRKELEEEDKRQKRLEKTKLDRERQLQREAELLEKEEQKRKLMQEEEQRIAEANKKRVRAQPILVKNQVMDPKTKLEKLLESTVPKPTTTSGGVHGVTPSKQDHTQKFLQQWSKMLKGNSRPGYHNSPKPYAVNTTFTVAGTPEKNTTNAIPIKTPDNYHVLPGSVLSYKVKEKLQGITSYEMTPAENDPLYAYENYDIRNLSSEDSTDDEDCPKKEIPQWACPESLSKLMEIQENTMAKNAGSVAHIFPPEELLRDPDLARIFRQKRKRFYHRSSSAQWDSPMYKRY